MRLTGQARDGELNKNVQERREGEDATIPLATTSRGIGARRANGEENSQGQVICVFAPTPARTVG
jgi:hypothetical protein